MADGIFIGLQRQPSKYASIAELIERTEDNCPIAPITTTGAVPDYRCAACGCVWTYPARPTGLCVRHRDPIRGGLLT